MSSRNTAVLSIRVLVEKMLEMMYLYSGEGFLLKREFEEFKQKVGGEVNYESLEVQRTLGAMIRKYYEAAVRKV